MFLDALQALAVPVADVIDACKEAGMPQPLIDKLTELEEEKELFSQLEPAQCHTLAEHLIGDPRVSLFG